MPKVLVIRLSSIGDIVLTTPVLRCLKQQLPQAQVHFCVKEKFKGVVQHNPHIDRLHTLKASLWELVAELRREKFDYIIDLHHNPRTLLLKAALGVYLPGGPQAHSFDKLNWEKWLFTTFKINRLPNVHIVDRYLAAAAPLGIKPDGKGLEYHIPYADEVELSWLPETHQKSYVAFVIGGSYPTKKLPLPRMIELCDKINRPIVLLGGKEDAEEGEQIAKFFNYQMAEKAEDMKILGKKTVIYNACGKFNLNQSASLVRQASVVFAHDTGLMHIAAAFGKTVYSIWGNTTPLFGMYPYRTRFVVLENNKLQCRPCSKLGHKACPKGHFKCMNDIVFDFWLP